MTARIILALGAFNAALAIALGAFAAHGLRAEVSADLLQTFNTAADYHRFHALGLLACGLLQLHWQDNALLRWGAGLMLGGILLFCGSLYLLVLLNQPGLGAITPFGGLGFIFAWLLITLAVGRQLGGNATAQD